MEYILRPTISLARGMALLGGIVLTGLIILACISILGRSLITVANSDWIEVIAPTFGHWLAATSIGPVVGDFELIEAGIAFTIFAFLPVCQLQGSHAVVDVFTNLMPASVNRFLVALWEVVMAIVILVIAWRLFVGMSDKIQNGQTTFMLQFPVWWAFAASFIAAVVAALISLYCAIARVSGVIESVDTFPDTITRTQR